MNIENIIDAAIQTKYIVSVLQETKISFSDLEEISGLNPKITDNLRIIRDWVKYNINNDIVDKEIVPESTSILSKPAIKTNRSSNYNRITYEDVKVITENVIVKYHKKDIKYAIKAVCKKYNKRFSEKSLERLVNKTTFSNITDSFYTIDNNIVIVKTMDDDNKIEKPESTNLTVKIHADKFNDFIRTLETKKGRSVSEKVRNNLAIIWNTICDNDGHIESSAKSFEIETFREYLSVKAVMVNMGLYDHDAFDVAIMISDGVTKYGKHRSGRIYSYVEKHYKTKLTTEFLNKVLNKEVFEEVTDKFFK